MSDSAPPKHVYLVDGSGFIFRAFHALPPMTRPDGTPVNAVYGFTAMLMKLLSETDADHIAVVFDAKRENFRNEIYPDYKANAAIARAAITVLIKKGIAEKNGCHWLAAVVIR